MPTSFLNPIVMTVLGAAMLCGCAADSPKATPAPLPRDAALDAYVGAMRADLSDGKTQLIGGVMNLSNEEAKVFWPIYQDYESELFDLGDQRVDLIRRFAAMQRSGKMEQREATELANGYFRFEQQRVDLLRKYHDIIAAELSPFRAAQFTQIEHRVGTVVDLAIAAKIPLLHAVPSAPAR